jgi:hypothetical protein
MSGLPLSMAFGISPDDVINVFDRNDVEIGEEEANLIFDLLDCDAIAVAAVKASTDLDEQTEAAYEEIELQLNEKGIIISEGNDLFTTCSICKEQCLSRFAHLHQGEWIGDGCCWDERLHSSE